ncbi:MAG: oligosaccharyltransferase complex subunit epsilon [Sclerophora amabilis]|nr:MAG: oligosaccharyltransferase complex subunit epsilon [Sclerophora amabilis]
MAPKRSANTSTPQSASLGSSSSPYNTRSSPSTSKTTSASTGGSSRPPSLKASSSSTSPTAIFNNLLNNYDARTPQRVKLLDAFMAFLLVVGALQFLYCVVGGNYPFNAFLSGFSATVGQFVLTGGFAFATL